MNLNNITSKIKSNAGLIGKLYGYAGPIAKFAGQQNRDFLEYAMVAHQDALESLLHGKFPKPALIIDFIQNENLGGPMFKNGLIAYILGELGGSIIGASNASALKKFGIEAMKFTALYGAVWALPHNPHGPTSSRGASYGY